MMTFLFRTCSTLLQPSPPLHFFCFAGFLSGLRAHCPEGCKAANDRCGRAFGCFAAKTFSASAKWSIALSPGRRDESRVPDAKQPAGPGNLPANLGQRAG